MELLGSAEAWKRIKEGVELESQVHIL